MANRERRTSKPPPQRTGTICVLPKAVTRMCVVRSSNSSSDGSSNSSSNSSGSSRSNSNSSSSSSSRRRSIMLVQCGRRDVFAVDADDSPGEAAPRVVIRARQEITAMAPGEEGDFAVGLRDGSVQVWRLQPGLPAVLELDLPPPPVGRDAWRACWLGQLTRSHLVTCWRSSADGTDADRVAVTPRRSPHLPWTFRLRGGACRRPPCLLLLGGGEGEERSLLTVSAGGGRAVHRFQLDGADRERRSSVRAGGEVTALAAAAAAATLTSDHVWVASRTSAGRSAAILLLVDMGAGAVLRRFSLAQGPLSWMAEGGTMLLCQRGRDLAMVEMVDLFPVVAPRVEAGFGSKDDDDEDDDDDDDSDDSDESEGEEDSPPVRRLELPEGSTEVHCCGGCFVYGSSSRLECLTEEVAMLMVPKKNQEEEEEEDGGLGDQPVEEEDGEDWSCHIT